MPPPWLAQTPPPIDPSAPAAAAVAQGVNTAPARTISGTMAAATATPLGATGLTVGQNAGFSGVGAIAADDAGIPAFGWVVTLIYQGAKNSGHVNQDTQKWFLIPIMAFLLVALFYLLTTHGDWLAACAQAIKSCGLVSANAIGNYHSVKPLGWFGSAAEMH